MEMDWTDRRPVDEIPFAQDPKLPSEERERRQARIREIFKACGCQIAEDIVQLGCTGLTALASTGSPIRYMGGAPGSGDDCIFVRENMTGSGIGLPCYVPPDRFCLVHNVVGGLQAGQALRHPESLLLCSRDLTDEERKRWLAVDKLANKEALKEAQDKLGVEAADTAHSACPDDVKPVIDAGDEDDEDEDRLLDARFLCPEHSPSNPEWRCRFCLAAAIVNGPFEPTLVVEVPDRFYVGQDIKRFLDAHEEPWVRLYVQVARWTRKLVKEG